MTDNVPVRRRWSWPRRLLLVVLVVAAGVALLLATGLPQRALLRAVLAASVDARVEVGSVSTLGAVGISRLALYEPGDLKGPPAVLVEGLALDYWLLSKGGRRVPSLTLDRLDVDFEKAQRILPKKKRQPKPSRFNLESLIPEQVRIKSLNVQSTAPSYAFKAQGLSLDAAVPNPQTVTDSITGDNVTASLWTRSGGFSREVGGGKVLIELARTAGSTKIQPLSVALPDLLDVSGSVNVAGKRVEVSFDKLTAQNVDLSHADPADLAVPFGFKRIDMSGTRVQGDVMVGAFNISVPETVVKLAAEGLVLGPQGAEYYQGDLNVNMVGTAGAQADYVLEATLNRGQKLIANLKGHHLACTGQAILEGWSREDVLAALPTNMRGGISSLPLLERLNSAQVDFEWKLPALKVTGAVAADFVVNGEKRPARLTFAGEGPLLPAAQRAFKVNADAELAGGKVAVASELAASPAKTTLTLQDVDPALWLYTLNERDMLNDLVSKFSGTLVVEPGGGPQQLRASIDLKATPLGYGPIVTPEGKTVIIAGNIEADTGTFGYVRGPELTVTIDEDNQLVLRNWNFPMEDFALSGDVDCRLDLSMLEHLLPGSDLRGRVALKGPLKNDRGFMNLESSGTIEGLGYKDYAAPYGVPIQATGTFSFDNLNGRLTGRNFNLTLPEGTSLASDGWTFTGSTAQFTMPFALKTDFKPLEPMGLLDQVKGGAGTATGTFAYGSDGANVDVQIEAAADAIVVGGARAALTGVTATAGFSNEPGGPVRGQGQVKAANMAALGAVFEQVEGPVTMEGGLLRAPELKGTLYGGSATADIEVKFLAENLPVQVRARAENVDLGLFTGTLGVPAVQMTGLAGGDATVAFTYPAGIQDLQAKISSSRNFTVSAYLVERLLAMQFAKQYAGERQLEKVRAKIIGKETQRPFDSGQLVLNYQGERIAGQAALKSKDLDLTVDLQMDTEAFFSALTLAQEARIERLGVAPDQEKK
ncbi:MAG: hypothetical protein NTZ09_14910 [Candidatus Hydrogenedentes bacterium]|nr:hypothetical protein [Candidatus Hydrogenedentota bacterium]